jgi:aryl sulfotransferase
VPLSSPEPPTRRYGGKLAAPERWDMFAPRQSDIVVCTPPKSGTTWIQGILALLISGDPEVDADITNSAPWLDVGAPAAGEVFERLKAQTQRRQVKTHTPFDGIPIWKELRYISAYRHPIDVHFSFRRHVENMTAEVLTDVFPSDISEGFRIFVTGDHTDGASLSSIVDHYRSALALDRNENILRLHYADMLRHPEEAFRQIAWHVGISYPGERMYELFQASTFENMKANAERFAVAAREGFWTNDANFFDSASSQKWRGKLSAEDLECYEAKIRTLLSPEERHWLECGSQGNDSAQP